MVATFVSPGLRRVRIGICVLLSAPFCAAFAAPSYDFAYRVSGDRRVAPQQVFDDGASTYLQFYPGQVLPALIAVASDGSQRLLTHAQLGPYVTVSGTHAGLVAQLGNVRAAIDYSGKGARVAGDDAGGLIAIPPAMPTQATPLAAPSTGQGVPFAPPWASAASAAPSPSPQSAPPAAVSARPTTTAASTATPLGAGPSRDIAPVTAQSAPSTDAVTVAEAWPLVASASPAKPFEATLADQNLRRALGRWATQAGWTFRAEHWTPDIDIAVSAPALFSPDFKTAVRGLLSGTELSARPLQPCFYANLVLRVVPQAERCDRRVAH